MIYRKPVCADTYYAADFAELQRQISDSYFSKLGPGDLPISRGEKKLAGILVPASSYSLAGACAAWAYKEVAEHAMPEVYIILGTNHHLLEPHFSTYLFSSWETPFGFVQTNKRIGLQLIKQFSPLRNETSAHSQELSVELQLPFLQDASKDRLQGLSFLPLCISPHASLFACKKLGQALAQLECSKTVIVSANFLSYGPQFQYTPFKYNRRMMLDSIRDHLFAFIQSFDAEGLAAYVEKHKLPWPELLPLVCGLSFFKAAGMTTARLLSYYSSDEVGGAQENITSFGSFSFY